MQLNWLHITDFHAGQGGQKRLWPQAQQLFFEQLPELQAESGPWDLILFTGDLAFSGQPEQYHQVDELLETLRAEICKLQEQPPILLAVPGNHDLDRSLANAAHNREGLHNHRRWIEDPKLRDIFWDSETSSIRQAVDEAFAEYSKWWKRQAVWTKPPPGLTITEGLLPGDFAATFEKDGIPFGILGLNSAFLQLTDEDYRGKLGIGVEQFHAACGGNGVNWAAGQCANLLITHHPWAWLEPTFQGELLQEIMGGRRFALHLCGHLHQTYSMEQRTGGGDARRLFQTRSLFGLERHGDGLQRRHGLCAGRLEIDTASATGIWQAWPRMYHLTGDDWDIIPDPDLRLDPASGRSSTRPKSFDLRPGCMRASAKTQVQPDVESVAQPDTELAKAISTNLKAAPGLAEHPPGRPELTPVFSFPWACDWGEDDYGPWVAFRIKGLRQVLRWVPPGAFRGERPARAIISRGLWLADTTCTQGLWQAVMGRNPSRFQGQERPVENLSWDDVQDFLQRLNDMLPGLEARLPSEAEWEHGCRAGTETAFWFGDAITTDQVNYDGNYPTGGAPKGAYRKQTVDVTALPCNAWGLYQMHGNVWEWCSDWYADYPSGEQYDPEGPDTGVRRVCRGGGWFSHAVFCRSARRDHWRPDQRLDNQGFRLARGPEAGPAEPVRSKGQEDGG
jgi:sulfatase modifying factor 1